MQCHRCERLLATSAGVKFLPRRRRARVCICTCVRARTCVRLCVQHNYDAKGGNDLEILDTWREYIHHHACAKIHILFTFGWACDDNVRQNSRSASTMESCGVEGNPRPSSSAAQLRPPTRQMSRPRARTFVLRKDMGFVSTTKASEHNVSCIFTPQIHR